MTIANEQCACGHLAEDHEGWEWVEDELDEETELGPCNRCDDCGVYEVDR